MAWVGGDAGKGPIPSNITKMETVPTDESTDPQIPG